MNSKFLRLPNVSNGRHIKCASMCFVVSVGRSFFSFQNVNVLVFFVEKRKDPMARYCSVDSIENQFALCIHSKFSALPLCSQQRYYVTENLAKCLYKGRIYYADEPKRNVL